MQIGGSVAHHVIVNFAALDGYMAICNSVSCITSGADAVIRGKCYDRLKYLIK